MECYRVSIFHRIINMYVLFSYNVFWKVLTSHIKQNHRIHVTKSQIWNTHKLTVICNVIHLYMTFGYIWFTTFFVEGWTNQEPPCTRKQLQFVDSVQFNESNIHVLDNTKVMRLLNECLVYNVKVVYCSIFPQYFYF